VHILHEESKSVKTRAVLIVFVVLMVITPVASANGKDSNLDRVALSAHDITMDANSWISFPVLCQSGDTLSGEFVVKKDGELYPGDQTEYDLWLLTGIDFLILDESNYELWMQGDSTAPIFEMKTLAELTWSIVVPHEGVWYVVYVNNSIYMKQVEGSIRHPVSGEMWLIVIALVTMVPIIGIVYTLWKKGEELWQLSHSITIYYSGVDSSSTGSGSSARGGASSKPLEGRNSSISS
jgi:hypothetical protein